MNFLNFSLKRQPFREVKKLKEKGVLPDSKLFFHTASSFAKQALYYLYSGGKYILNNTYETKRNYFDQFLFLHVLKGKMEVHYKNREFIGEENTFIFIDCHEPHLYKTLVDTEYNWIHFRGNATKNYFDRIFEKKGCVFSLKNNWQIPNFLNQIISMMEDEEVDEHETSILIHQILYELEKISNQADHSLEETVKQAIAYIEEHYSEKIDLQDLASHVNLSPFHFSRVFKKQTNFTPHQYLINYRVNQAKRLLFHSNLSINEIAFQCGFNSVSHFTTTFKSQTNFSPKQYRDYMFRKKG